MKNDEDLFRSLASLRSRRPPPELETTVLAAARAAAGKRPGRMSRSPWGDVLVDALAGASLIVFLLSLLPPPRQVDGVGSLMGVGGVLARQPSKGDAPILMATRSWDPEEETW